MNNLRIRRPMPEVNAGSMADIAFLLLIFFLVTTTIMEDQGIRVRLPPWEVSTSVPIPENNVLSVLVNASNVVMLEQEKIEIAFIRERTKYFIMNPKRLNNLPASPKNAVVSLQNDRGTSYERYLEVYNEIKAAYHELWEEVAQRKFNKSYTDLKEIDRSVIRKDIPLVISEAEPTDVHRSVVSERARQ